MKHWYHYRKCSVWNVSYCVGFQTFNTIYSKADFICLFLFGLVELFLFLPSGNFNEYFGFNCVSDPESPLMAQSLTHKGWGNTLCQFLITFLFPPPLSEGSLEQQPPFPLQQTLLLLQPRTGTQQPRWGQRGSRREGRGKQPEVKAAVGGHRWMNGIPQDQSGTLGHSRSSFSSSTLSNTASSLPPTNHTTS